MDALKGLFIAWAALLDAEMPEEEVRSAIKYIMDGGDYVERVKRSNPVGNSSFKKSAGK